MKVYVIISITPETSPTIECIWTCSQISKRKAIDKLIEFKDKTDEDRNFDMWLDPYSQNETETGTIRKGTLIRSYRTYYYDAFQGYDLYRCRIHTERRRHDT